MIKMKELKIISTAVMLITGIITAITGAVETIIKLVQKVNPVPLAVESSSRMEKSLSGVIEYIAIPKDTFWIQYQGLFLLLFGCLAIWLAIRLTYKIED